MDIIRTKIYSRKTSKLLSSKEIIEAEDEIARDPKAWPVIAGTGGLRKARASRGTSGKSGGVRIIYYFWMSEDSLYLLDVYPKNEKENLSAAEKKILKSIIEQLKGD